VPEAAAPSLRKLEILEAAYAYVLAHGMADVSLRPLASAVGSSPRVLLYLFGSKDGLIQALLARAREDELALLERLRRDRPGIDVPGAVAALWTWLAAPRRRELLVLWVEGYARSLVEPDGPWEGFARRTVEDWLSLFAACQPSALRRTKAARVQRTAALALLRGALLDLLATGDRARVSAALHRQLAGDRLTI
jgi:AcrR family transcriptional regulator